MILRETAWRVFAGELNNSTLEERGAEEKSPNYVISPLGAPINRVLIAGVLLEKENRGTDDDPLWSGRIQDASGNFFINVGRYQPAASVAMADLETPSYVAVVGKVRTYARDDGRVMVTVRPERIEEIDEETRRLWMLSTARATWERLLDMKKAIGGASIEDLVEGGMDRDGAEAIHYALEYYGNPDSTRYLNMIQNSLRALLPDEQIDLGLPEKIYGGEDEIVIDGPDERGSSEEEKEIIMRLIGELEGGGKDGADRESLEREAAKHGIAPVRVEELSNELMDEGQVYEPSLGYLKRV
ncbi:MAG: glycerol dehydrogenase [Thermoplasmatales archaeon]|nr:glycerol dehydrogenase [Thermoplasmatales archaeon]